MSTNYQGEVSKENFSQVYNNRFDSEKKIDGLSHAYLWRDKVINNEDQLYRRSQLSIERIPNTDQKGMCFTMDKVNQSDKNAVANAKGQKYLSGLATSYNHFSIGPYFRIEFDGLMAKGQGLWGAFWLLAIKENGRWPSGQAMAYEFDLVEKLGREEGIWYHIASHFMKNSPNDLHWSQPTKIGVDTYKVVNTYGVEFTPTGIYAYINNQYVAKFPMMEEYHDLEWHWLANLACGGGWAGKCDDTTPMPSKMYLREVRAFLMDDPAKDRRPLVQGGSSATNNTSSAPPPKPDTSHSGASDDQPTHEFSVETGNCEPKTDEEETDGGKRLFEVVEGQKSMRWNPHATEVKWNVFLNGDYHTTVLQPELKAPQAGEYRVEGITKSDKFLGKSQPITIT